MKDLKEQLEPHLNHALVAGERPLAALRLLPPCTSASTGAYVLVMTAVAISTGVWLGLPAGALLQALLSSWWKARADRSGFPATTNMVALLTTQRVLIWRRSFLFRRLDGVVGSFPVDRLAGVDVERGLFGPRVRFSFHDAPRVTVEANRRDDLQGFRSAWLALLSVAPASRIRVAAVGPPIPPPPPPIPPPPSSIGMVRSPSSSLAPSSGRLPRCSG